MDVLTLTAYADAPFMVQQMDALEERGVSFTTMSVAGEIDAETDRSPVDYIRTVPEIIREAGNGYDLIHAHYGLTGPIALSHSSASRSSSRCGDRTSTDRSHPSAGRLRRSVTRSSSCPRRCAQHSAATVG